MYQSDRVWVKTDAGWVNRVYLRNWNARNRAARLEYYAHPFEHETVEKKPKTSRRLWTKREIQYLRRKRREGVPYTLISKHLGRSVTACQLKAQKLGIAQKRTPREDGATS